MTFRSALRQSQYDLLHHPSRGIRSWSGDQYIDFDPCTVNFAARVNGALTADAPFASINFDTVTTGAYTDIEVDQVIVVSPTNDVRDPLALRFRARKTPTSTILYINETSFAIADNSYIFGLLTFDATDKLARPISATVQKKDYDLAYATLPPTVSGLQTGYAGMVGASGKLRLALSITASNGELGSTISSYAWTFAAGTYTVISGGLTAAAVTVDISPGWQWAKLVVTDSNGQVCRRHFAIAAHDDSVYTVSTIAFNGAQISASIDQGWTATFAAFDGIQNVLNGTFCIIWTDHYYNGFRTSITGPQAATVTNKALTSNVATITTSPTHYFRVGDVVCVDDVGSPFDGPHIIASAPTSTTLTFAATHANVVSVSVSGTAIVYRNSVDMIGWLDGETNRTENDPTAGIIPSVQFKVSGVAGRIAEVEAQMLAVRTDASPTEWDEIAGLTPQRSVIHYLHRHTTVLNLCDWYDDDPGTDVYEFPYVTPQGTNIADTIHGIVSTINAHIEFGPTGEIQMVRDARFRSDRFSITALGNFADVDLFDINEYTFDHYDKVGKVDFAGAFYNAASGNTQAFRARAPGYAQGSGAGSSSQVNQILALDISAIEARDELRQRVGDQLSIENKTRKLSLKQPDGYSFGVPSLADPYTWTLDTTYNRRNLSLTTADKWLLESISIAHDNEQGTRDVDWSYTNVTPIGDKGDNIPPIKEGEIPSFELPPLVPLPDFPAPEIGWTLDEVPSPDALKPPVGTVAALDGSTVLYWDDAGSGLWTTCTAVKLRSPLWREITPDLASGYAISCAMWDIFYSKTASPAYALAFDATNSRVYYTGNGVAGDVVWVEGATFSGQYGLIRPTSTRGTVLVYNPGNDNTTHYNFTENDKGFAPALTAGAAPSAVYSPGVGWVSNRGQWFSNFGDPDEFYGCGIVFTLPAGTKTRIDVTYIVAGTWPSGGGALCGVADTGSFDQLTLSGCILTVNTNTAPGTHTVSFIGSNANNDFGVTIGYGHLTSTSGATITITSIAVTYGTSAKIAVSTDYGATFSSPITVGTSPGVAGGFDVQYIGSVSYAAMAGKVRKATTLGGAYSDHTTYAGNPVCVVIPWARRNATDTGNLAVSDPDYLVAEDSGKLWWVDGAAATNTDVTPAGVTACNSANAISTWSGTVIRYVALVSGTPHLFRSIDGGATWADRGAVTGANFVRGRRKRTSSGDTTAINQIFVSGGASLKYSASNGAVLADRTKPSSSVGGIDVLG